MAKRARKISVKTIRLGRCKNQTGLLKKFEKLMRPIILGRDGHKCMISGYHHDCYGPLVMDHRPGKRKNHSTFLDPRNLTTVCNKANGLAERSVFISNAILDVVKFREGDIIEDLRILSKQTKKWSEEECMDWILSCVEYFKTNKNGKPVNRTDS